MSTEEERDQQGRLLSNVQCEEIWVKDLGKKRANYLTVEILSSSAEIALSTLLAGTGWSVGTVTVIGIHDLETEKESCLWNVRKVQEIWGGILVFDSETKTVSLYAEADYGNDSGVQIRYSKNLKSIRRTVDYEIATRLFPFGKDDLDISSANGGILHIDNFQYTNEVLEDAWINQDYDDPEELKAKATEVLEKLSRPRASYAVNLVDLSSIAGYEMDSFDLGDWITVFDPDIVPNGVKVRIYKWIYDVFNPWDAEVELGDPQETLADLLAGHSRASNFVNDSVAPNPSFRNLLKSVLDTYYTQINGANGKAVTEDGVTTYIGTDEQGNDNGLRVRISPAGIGFSTDYGANYTTALTGEGIAAPAVTTGKLAAGVVQVGVDTTFEDGYDPITKANTFRQPTPPNAIAVGDIWFNTADGNKPYRWSGVTWELVRDTDIDALNSFVNVTYPADFAYLEGLVDGNITTWFYAYVPTLENEPAVSWTTDTLKNNHLGDLFYDSTTGYAYRFVYENSVYSWQLIPDTGVANALALAQQAQDTADGKRRVFLVQPIPSYDVGDLWSEGPSGELKRCIVFRGEGESYTASDWEPAAGYTDDTRANQAMAAANAASVAAANAITAAAGAQATADGKVTTFFQPEPPEAEGEGDLWIDTNDGNKIYRSNGTYWVPAQDSGISQAIVAAADAQSIADRKIVTYYQDTEPLVAQYGDLWFDTNDGNKPYRYYGMERSTDTTGAYDPNDAINWVAVQDGLAANSVQQSKEYNGVTIDPASGLVVTRGDNKVRVILNATGGIKIQQLINGVWVDMLYADTDGSLTLAGKIKIGTGENVCKADENGLYLGSDTFGSAPFRVTPAGQVTATSGSFKGDVDCESLKINTVDVLEQLYLLAKSISSGTLKTGIGGITKVEGDILLGPGSTISWDSITDKDSVVEKTGTDYTYLQKDKIYSPVIEGGSIISNTTIDVTTDAKIGRKLILSPNDFRGGMQWGNAVDAPSIYYDPLGKSITIGGDVSAIYAKEQRIDQPQPAVFG